MSKRQVRDYQNKDRLSLILCIHNNKLSTEADFCLVSYIKKEARKLMLEIFSQALKMILGPPCDITMAENNGNNYILHYTSLKNICT